MLVWVSCLSFPGAGVGVKVPAPLGIHWVLSIMASAPFNSGIVLVFDVMHSDRGSVHVLPVPE